MKSKINSVTQKEFLPRTFSLKKTVNKMKTVSFKNYIEDYHKKKGDEKLEKLFQEIEKEKKILAETCTLSNLKVYKEKVKKFLSEILKNVYSLEEEKIWDKKGRKKILHLIKCVDKSLEELTKEFFQENIDRVKILEKLEEIKGMLVDIYH